MIIRRFMRFTRSPSRRSTSVTPRSRQPALRTVRHLRAYDDPRLGALYRACIARSQAFAAVHGCPSSMDHPS
jgi:hypothetical protein